MNERILLILGVRIALSIFVCAMLITCNSRVYAYDNAIDEISYLSHALRLHGEDIHYIDYLRSRGSITVKVRKKWI